MTIAWKKSNYKTKKRRSRMQGREALVLDLEEKILRNWKVKANARKE